MSKPALKLSRTTRKKLETKDKLLNSLQVLVLEHGVDSVSINDITEMADIGLGTFYNYFDSKNAILDELSNLFYGYYHRDLDKITADLTDPAEIFATSTYYTYGKVIDGSLWGKFLFDSGLPVDFYLGMMRKRSGADIRDGLSSGKFKIERELTGLNLSILGGMLISVTTGLYKGDLAPSLLTSISEQALMLLGVKKAKAQKISQSCVIKIPKQELPLSSYDLEIKLLEEAAAEETA